ncbi:hypothetical protein GH733_007379, partial [Mirounga leonina]
MWPMPWSLYLPRNMKYENHSIIHNNSHSIHRICEAKYPSENESEGDFQSAKLLIWFFPFHFILPFVVSALVIVHYFFMKQDPITHQESHLTWIKLQSKISHMLSISVLFSPDLLGDPDNILQPTPSRLPNPHIKP